MSSIAATNRAAVEGPAPSSAVCRVRPTSLGPRCAVRWCGFFSVTSANIATRDATYSGSDSISAIRPAKVSALPLERRKPWPRNPSARRRRSQPLHRVLTDSPTAAWTARQIIEAFRDDSALRYLLRDRDSIYGAEFRTAGCKVAASSRFSPPRARPGRTRSSSDRERAPRLSPGISRRPIVLTPAAVTPRAHVPGLPSIAGAHRGTQWSTTSDRVLANEGTKGRAPVASGWPTTAKLKRSGLRSARAGSPRSPPRTSSRRSAWRCTRGSPPRGSAPGPPASRAR